MYKKTIRSTNFRHINVFSSRNQRINILLGHVPINDD
jgi:hypothetical protein